MATVIFSSPREWVEHWKKAGPKVERALLAGAVAGAYRCIPIVQESVNTAPPANPGGKGSGGAFDTGGYFGRWKARATSGGAMVYNDHPAADVIEKGRHPGRRPPRMKWLAAWAKRRLGLSEEEAAAAAFPIARAIGRRGLLGRHVLERVIPKCLEVVQAEIRRELRAALGSK